MFFNGRSLFAAGAFSDTGNGSSASWVDKSEECAAWIAAQDSYVVPRDYFLTLTEAGAYKVNDDWYCVVYDGTGRQYEIMYADDENRREWAYIGDTLVAEAHIATDGADVSLQTLNVGGVELGGESPVKEEKPQLIETNAGKYYYPDGTLQNDAATITALLFAVQEGTRVIVDGALIVGSRSIVAFNDHGDFVKEIPATKSNAAQSFEIDVEGFTRLGLTTRNDFIFSIRYAESTRSLKKNVLLNEHETSDACGNYINAAIKMPSADEYEAGYLYSDGSVIAADNVLCSPFVEVIENQELVVGGMYTSAFAIVHFYDADKTHLGYAPHSVAGTSIQKTTIKIPYNVRYIRYSILLAKLSTLILRYADKIRRDHLPLELVEGWHAAAHKRLGNLYKNATAEPIITFIDDDTASVEAVTRFRDVCNSVGIKGSFAVITGQLERVENLGATLLQFEREGFTSVVHCNEQSGHVTLADGSKTSAYLTESRDLALCEQDLVDALRRMQIHEFNDYKLWCTPYGVRDADIQALARKWGLECLISSGRTEYETTEAKYGRFGLSRVSLQATDEAGGVTLEQFKQIIDNAVADNGWLLVTTHMGENAWADNLDRFRELVNYAKSAGMKVKTVNEAWRIRKPIYSLYEAF